MVTAWLLFGLCWAVAIASPTFDPWGTASSIDQRTVPPPKESVVSPRVFNWLSEGSIQNLFRGNDAEVQTIPGIYDSVCSGSSSETYPSGSCVNLATCLFSGGAAAPDSRDCGAFGGICCTHRLSCDDTMSSRVAYWESEDYPQLSSKAGACTLNIRPIRNACYIRVQFEDAVLTAPRADSCEGNTLTISGQKDGASGLLCGNLKGTETLVRVTEGMTGPFRVYDDVMMHMDIMDKWHKYKIKLTQIKCNQDVTSPVRVSRRSRAMGGLWLSPSENVNDTSSPYEDFRVRQIRNSLDMMKLLKQRQFEEAEDEGIEATVNEENSSRTREFGINQTGSSSTYNGRPRLRIVRKKNEQGPRKQPSQEIPNGQDLLNNSPSNYLGEQSTDHTSQRANMERQISLKWWQSLVSSFPQVAQMFDMGGQNRYMEFFQGVQPLRIQGGRGEKNVKPCKFSDPILCEFSDDITFADIEELNANLTSTYDTENKNSSSSTTDIKSSTPPEIFIDVQTAIKSATESEFNQQLSGASTASESKARKSGTSGQSEVDNLPGSTDHLESSSSSGDKSNETQLPNKSGARVITVRKVAELELEEELTEANNSQQNSGGKPQSGSSKDNNTSAGANGTEQGAQVLSEETVSTELNVTADSLETISERGRSQEYGETSSQKTFGRIRERAVFNTDSTDSLDAPDEANYASRMGGGYNGVPLQSVHPVNFIRPENYESGLSALSESLLTMMKSRNKNQRNEPQDTTYSDDKYEYFRDVGIGSLSLEDRSAQVYEFHPPGEWRPSSLSKIQASPKPPKIYELSLTEVLARMPQHKLERYALDLQKHSELSEDLLLQKLNELVFSEIQARTPFPQRMFGDVEVQPSKFGGQQNPAIVSGDTAFAILVSPIRKMPELDNPQALRNYFEKQNNYPNTNNKNYQESLANLNRFSSGNSNTFQNANAQNNNYQNSYQNSYSNAQSNKPSRNDFNDLLETVNILKSSLSRNENNYQNVPESNLNMRPNFEGSHSVNNYPNYPASANSQSNAFVGALSSPQPTRFNPPFNTGQGQSSQAHLPSLPNQFQSQLQPQQGMSQLSQDEPFRTEKEASYYGFLVLKNEADEYFFCSATLISPLHALTAASCVLRKGFALEPYRTHVVFSNDDLGPPVGRSGAMLFNHPNHKRVKRVVFHPMYKHNNFHYDIAVLELESEVINSKPIKIAQPDTDVRDSSLTMMGHGARPSPRLTFDAYEQHLTYISARYLNYDSCSENYDESKRKRFSYLEKLIKPEMLCLLSTEGTQLCEGDQGGPVVLDFMTENKEPRLVGLATGNDNNCISVARSELGAFPDLAVRLTWPIVEFIEMATSDFSFRE